MLIFFCIHTSMIEALVPDAYFGSLLICISKSQMNVVIALGSAQAGRRIDLFGGRDVLAAIGRARTRRLRRSPCSHPFIDG
ncbi:hypothetical protein V1290_006927 [Bradyrhizobium sp. AZCC 1578]